MGFVSIIYLVFAKQIITAFNSTDAVVENGALCLQIIAAGYVFYAYGMVVSNAFNGAGDTKTPTKINLVSFWLFQLPLAYLLAIVLGFGAIGVFIAITTAEILLAAIAIVWFRKGSWKTVEV